MCALAGVSPGDVGRHRWARCARDARTAGNPPATRRPPMTALAYIWGDDAWSIDRAARDLARTGPPTTARRSRRGAPRWTTIRASRTPAAAASAGAGCWTRSGCGSRRPPCSVVARSWSSASREHCCGRRPRGERTTALLDSVAPGNGLCFVDLIGQDAKGPAASGVLRDAVAAAGGLVREMPALTRERMEAWLAERAAELGVRLGPGAAQALAQRVGRVRPEGGRRPPATLGAGQRRAGEAGALPAGRRDRAGRTSRSWCRRRSPARPGHSSTRSPRVRPGVAAYHRRAAAGRRHAHAGAGRPDPSAPA